MSADVGGLPVQHSAPQDLNSKVTYDAPTGKSYGVRIPVLRDLDGNYHGKRTQNSCRFDIVEKVTTVIKPGDYGPDDIKSKSYTDDGQYKRIGLSRQPTFHSTTSNLTSNQKDTSVLSKISSYHWNQWVKYGQDDARDVLYRNTYCTDPEQVRYRTLTLPRISTTPGSNDRPWTVAGDEKLTIPKHENGEYSKIVTIVPQQPRGTVVRFRELMKPVTNDPDVRAFEVKRYSSRITANNPPNEFPMIRHDFRRSPRKTERPLKSENVRYNRRSYKDTLFNKYMMPLYKQALNRDYSSADTFKEYLDSLQYTAKANTPGLHPRGEMTGYRDYEVRHTVDYHNKVLQSVSDVNQPDVDREISVEIKQSRKEGKPETREKSDFALAKQPSIENLSSVHGSVVRAHSETHSVTIPRSSSVADAKAIVKIPSVVSEAAHGGNTEQNASFVSNKEVLPEGKLDTVDENGSLCPANTPIPPV